MEMETILVVEDNYLLQIGLKETLEESGFRVLVAENGKRALRIMESSTPDLILSDIAMPEMDGFAFFKAVRAQAEWLAIPFIFLTARGERQDILAGKGMGAEDYLVKPVTPFELVRAVQSRLERARELQLVQRGRAYEASLTVLANAIEVRDRYTRGHVERVTAYALTLGRLLGIAEPFEEELRFGAILHDIGKIHVPERILGKDDALTDEEWQEMRRHPVSGVEMIHNISYLAPAGAIIRHHHERWDGQGYPDGLAGEAIPLGARIVAVADSFDAITTARSYHEPMALDDAYEEIRHGAGTRYDPRVVAAFEDAWAADDIRTIFESYSPGS
jgi:putative two-component system response regulator